MQEKSAAQEEKATINLDVLKGSEFDRLIRYGYSGFLMTGLLLFLVPDRIRPALEAGGSVVAPLVILAAGAAIYTLYRYFLNEIVVAPCLHGLHAFLDRRRDVPTNPANFLRKYNLPWHLRHPAYVEIRRGFFDDDVRRSFDRNHTEATIIWITSVECIVAGAVLFSIHAPDSEMWKACVLMVLGCFSLFAAVVMDIRLFKQECRVLIVKETALEDFLRKRGFIAQRDGGC